MLYYLGAENEKVVLFIDIIGFGDLVKRNDGFIPYREPHDIALMFPIFYNDLISNRFSKDMQEARRTKFLWVSDSIIISTDIDNTNCLLNDLIYLQNQMYCAGMAFRGAICIGNLFHQDNVWGKPLVRAVDLEKDKCKSVYPRVIIFKDELARLPLNEHYLKYFEQNELNHDYFSWAPFSPNLDLMLSEDRAIIHSNLNRYVGMIITNFDESENNAHKDKWRWMARKLIDDISLRKSDIVTRLNNEAAKGYPNCILGNIEAELERII